MFERQEYSVFNHRLIVNIQSCSKICVNLIKRRALDIQGLGYKKIVKTICFVNTVM